MAAATLLLVAALAAVGPAETGSKPPANEPRARIEARLEGRRVPDIPLQLADGRSTTLAELGRRTPLLVTFFYRRCAGVCTPFLHWIDNATEDVGGLGEDYEVLALSFDDADTAADLRRQAEAFGLHDHPHWHFAITSREALAEISGALDFWYRQVEGGNQYDHGSLLAAVRHGRVLRALSGGPGQTQRLRELVWELRGRVVPYYAVEGGPAMRCVEYDPVTGQLRPNWGLLILVLPAICALLAAAWAFRPGTRRASADARPAPGR
jgi:cytochrome oxidase Cu insertion factor (SCO1/SenC/PrrC family)